MTDPYVTSFRDEVAEEHERIHQELMEALAQFRAMIDREEESRRRLHRLRERAA